MGWAALSLRTDTPRRNVCVEVQQNKYLYAYIYIYRIKGEAAGNRVNTVCITTCCFHVGFEVCYLLVKVYSVVLWIKAVLSEGKCHILLLFILQVYMVSVCRLCRFVQ